MLDTYVYTIITFRGINFKAPVNSTEIVKFIVTEDFPLYDICCDTCTSVLILYTANYHFIRIQLYTSMTYIYVM